MGLLSSNTTYNNTLKINACSGGIYKTYKESWFKRFNLKSVTAEQLFKPYDRFSDVIILQMVICGDMEVIAELIKKEDFDKYTETSDNENNLEKRKEMNKI